MKGENSTERSRSPLMLYARIIGGYEILIGILGFAFALLAGVNGWLSDHPGPYVALKLGSILLTLTAGVLLVLGMRTGFWLSLLTTAYALFTGITGFGSLMSAHSSGALESITRTMAPRFMPLDVVIFIALLLLLFRFSRSDADTRQDGAGPI